MYIHIRNIAIPSYTIYLPTIKFLVNVVLFYCVIFINYVGIDYLQSDTKMMQVGDQLKLLSAQYLV